VTESRRVIAFDVNETLLDLGALDPLFERAFGSAAVRTQWFGQMLQIAFTGGLTGDYVDFSTAQAAALEMVAAAHGVALDDTTRADVRDGMRALPPHRDAGAALARLHDSPLQVVALTNSPLDVARAQLSHAGLDRHFDAILSADEVQALKPRPEAYALVADRCEVPLADVRLVAAHAWDVTGALAAGCAAAFVRRPGKFPNPIGPQPDIVGHDLAEVADGILAELGRP
jgi:2-haloacid dehalogenase